MCELSIPTVAQQAKVHAAILRRLCLSRCYFITNRLSMFVEDAFHLWFSRILRSSVAVRCIDSIVVRSYRCLCRFECHHMWLPNLCDGHFVCFQRVSTVFFSFFSSDA
jgi:hypothetical protein